ncbi:S-layer homology domain-containing protein [Paenibacillus sp. FSL H7-0323]|uniref:S-layer homology domain-containing protein n=1 Tax=Paenibacillus sp. FSL H7-0323 TaxID=2921433 RepID=UPI0030F60E25
MKRIRSAMAGLLALLLIFSSLPVMGTGSGSVGAEGVGGTGAEQIPSGTVLIKNKWKNNFLYETSAGIVRYGMTNPADASAHWTVETVNGLSRIKNVKTGHYITMAGNNGKEDSLKAAEHQGSGSVADQWLIDTSNRNGYMIIRSATVPEGKLVIHEENQLGYAQVSSDINVTFESPQWAFIDLNAAPVRLESRLRPGQVMYESEGNVLYGKQPVSNEAAQWYLESGTDDGTVMIRNRATGHYIKQNEVTWAGVFSQEVDMDHVKLSEWVQEHAPGPDGTGFITLRNSGLTEEGSPLWLNPQFSDDNNVRSNSWPGSASNPSAQWRIVPISELQPVRLATYTDAQVATDFLYESANGELKHGIIAPDAANTSDYLWYIEDYDGNKRIRNAATDHYVSYSEGTAKALQISGSQPSDQWIFNDSDDYDDYQTLQNLESTGIYLSTLGGEHAGAIGDATSLSAQWQLLDPNTPTDGTVPYYRIQNGWKSFYWYESVDGLLKYGNMQKDGSDQWLVEKYNGRKLFKNKKTGHYMNTMNMPNGHLQVTELPDRNHVEREYIWTGKNVGNNTYVISSVLDKEPNKIPEKYISLQNLTKYAEYGVINPGWGSPQWRFVPVTEKKQDLFRFQLDAVNGEDQYLKDGPLLTSSAALEELPESKTVTEAVYADQDSAHSNQNLAPLAAANEDVTVGQATYGPLDLNDDSFVWQLQEIAGSNGSVKIKNKGTGRYLSLEHIGGAVDEIDPKVSVQTLQTVYDVWASIKWKVDMQPSGVTTIMSSWAGHYIYGAPDDNGNPILRISKAADTAEKSSAHFTAEAVEAIAPPLPDYPVRFKNASSGEYLYENERGVVLYGQPSADNGFSHWNVTVQEGKQTITNRATGHFLTLNGDYSYLESSSTDPAVDGASAWEVSLASDYTHYTIRSLFGEYDDELINIANKTGYAERALLLESEGTALWTLEAAPQEFTTPSGELRNNNTTTPVQNDTNIITIVPKGMAGKVLAEKEGAVLYADASDMAAQSQWLVQEINGRKRIMNVQTQHYLSLNESGQVVLLAAGDTERSQWKLEEKLGYALLLSANGTGLLSHSTSAVQLGSAANGTDSELWSFLPIPADAIYAGGEAFKGERVIRFAVNAQQAGEYDAVIRYKNTAAAATDLALEVNGLHEGGKVSLGKSASWKTVVVKLQLRAGINTVSLSSDNVDWSKVTLDSLTVKNSVNKTYRGATVPYISYEAEDAATNGTLIGSSRKYLSMASEASGRQAVALKNTGDYLEFKLAESANSIVLRYSIPDSPDGAGAEETLTLYVDGIKKQLKLTSKYAWEYGSYPWSNDPRQGSGHRFFDEIHALIGDAPAGATIRLEKGTGDNAASYVIDLVDMEQVAPELARPDGFISVTDFGAAANDEGDDTAAFKAALAEANATGKGVWFPAGTFNVGEGLLDLDTAEIRGAGMWYTVLNGAKFYGHGGKVGVYDLMIEGGINERDDEAITNAFHGAFGQGSIIQNVWIEHTKAGLWLTQPMGEKARTNGLYMAGLRIRNLMADGINFAVGTGNSMMEQSDIRYPGDDGIAMWSFTDGKLTDVNGTERTPSYNNTARFNTVSLPWLADNIVVFGGKDNKVQDNVVKDTVTNGAGIAVSTRFTAEPFQGTTIVERNTLLRTGSYDSGYGVNLGALWLYAGESDLKGKVLIRNNTALDSTYSGLIAQGDLEGDTLTSIDGVVLTNNVLDGAGTSGIEVTKNLKGSLLVDNMIIRGERMNLLTNASPDLSIKEQNQGIASAIKPFSIKLADGQSGPVILEQGKSATLKVLDKEGRDLTAQATLNIMSSEIATFTNDSLNGIQAGITDFTVTVGNEKRGYTIEVLSPGGTDPVDPIDPVDPTSTPSPTSTPEPTSTPGPTDPTGSVNPVQPGIPTATPAPTPAANHDAQLKAKATAGQAVIEISANGDGTARFSADALRKAAALSPKAVLVIESGGMSYRFPLELVESVLKAAQMPAGTLEFNVNSLSGKGLEQLLVKAKQQGFTVQGTPANFTLKVTDGKTSVAASGFGTTYVDRTFMLKEALDAKTGVVLIYDEQTGSFRYVPALYEPVNGMTKVTVKSSIASGVFVAALHPVTFGDIATHWARNEIEGLASRLILTGQSTDTFAPQKSVSRAEFAAMLIRSLGLVAANTTKTFSDVSDLSWYAADARAAAALGLVQGYEDGTFRPNAPITREQMAVMAARAMKLLNLKAEGSRAIVATDVFTDASTISSWAKEAVSDLAAKGIMKGQPSGSFVPSSDTSRAEAAVILVRLLRAAELLN